MARTMISWRKVSGPLSLFAIRSYLYDFLPSNNPNDLIMISSAYCTFLIIYLEPDEETPHSVSLEYMTLQVFSTTIKPSLSLSKQFTLQRKKY